MSLAARVLQEFMLTETMRFPLHGTADALGASASEPNADAFDSATDYELAQRTAGGEMRAFEEPYRRHHRRVYAVCLRMTRNAADAEDLTQMVFVNLFSKIGSFRGEAAFPTWLRRMTVNQVLIHFRKFSVRMERTTADGETPAQIGRGTANPAQMPIIERIALNAAVAQLPPGYREVFWLHDVEGYEHEEIARMRGCTIGTSKSQLHKARLKLRSLIRSEAPARRINNEG